jgi:phosphomannomutase
VTCVTVHWRGEPPLQVRAGGVFLAPIPGKPGPVIRNLLSAGIIGTGEEVLDTGIVPTPVIVYGLVCAQAREILIAPGAESPTDGIHNEDESGWCRIRASGTKPKIRCTAEGTDLTHAKAMLRAGRDLIRTWKSA